MRGSFEYRILGPLEVVRFEQVVPVRSRAQRIILAGLLLWRGRVVPAERLLEWLCDGGPASASPNALQLHIKRLRGTLGASDQIVHRSGGYLMPAGSGGTDLARFDALVVAARTAARAGEAGTALAHLRAACRLWTGPILADVASPALHAAEVCPLTERCLQVCEQRFELELSDGTDDGIVQELTALCARYPLRERLLGQLMRALHRSGRQVEALEAYRRYAGRLREEFGLDPGPHLRELEMAILRGTPEDTGPAGPDAQPPPAPAPEPTAWQGPHRHLPRATGDFVGRRAQVLDAERVLTHPVGPPVPVVAVTGTAGIGKSAFALHVAHQVSDSFPDGQLYAGLHGSSTGPPDLADVLADLAMSLGVPYQALPPGRTARTALLRDLLTDRKVLLVIDDAGSAAQVETLLPATPGCAVLVTSRHLLGGLTGAHRIRLPPLSKEEGVERKTVFFRLKVDGHDATWRTAIADELYEFGPARRAAQPGSH